MEKSFTRTYSLIVRVKVRYVKKLKKLREFLLNALLKGSFVRGEI